MPIVPTIGLHAALRPVVSTVVRILKTASPTVGGTTIADGP